VLLLEIPPLRERGEDILVLAQHFLRHYAEGHGLLPKRLSHEAEAWLQSYGWPGTVRELSHLMERVTLLCTEVVVNPPTLEQLCLPRPFLPGRSQESPGRGKAEPLDEAARMRQALSQTEGNVLRAARLLGISRGTLRYWMRRYGISPPRGKAVTPRHDNRAQATDRLSEAERGASTSVEHLGLEAAWEQKPVAVLAIDVTWPEARDRTTPGTEP
jgi:DNA-binding NtrC family response regulator